MENNDLNLDNYELEPVELTSEELASIVWTPLTDSDSVSESNTYSVQAASGSSGSVLLYCGDSAETTASLPVAIENWSTKYIRAVMKSAVYVYYQPRCTKTSESSGYNWTVSSVGNRESVYKLSWGSASGNCYIKATVSKAPTFTINYEKGNANKGSLPSDIPQTKYHSYDLTLKANSGNLYRELSGTNNIVSTIATNNGSLSNYTNPQTSTDTYTYTYKATGWTGSVNGTTRTFSFGGSYTYNYGTTLTPIISSTASSKSHVYSSINLPTASQCTRTGYTLNKFTDESGNSYSVGGKISPEAAHTYTANWSLTDYTIKFYANDGTSNYKALTVHYKNACDSITPHTREGYNFLGYYTTATGGTQWYDKDGNPVSAGAKSYPYNTGLNLYAHWEVSTYDVKFSVNNSSYGSVTSTTCTGVPHGSSITSSGNKIYITKPGGTSATWTVVATPTKSTYAIAYSFSSWSYSVSSITSATSVTANFSASDVYHTLSKVSDPSGACTIELAGTKESSSSNNFKGGTSVNVKVTITDTAHHTFNSLKHGDTSIAVSSSDGKVYVGSFTVTAAETVTAKMDIAKYTVSFVSNNTEYGTVDTSTCGNIPYGSTVSYSTTSANVLYITAPGATSAGWKVTADTSKATYKYNYSFSSWSVSSGSFIKGAATITANFTRQDKYYALSTVSEPAGVCTIELFDTEKSGELFKGGSTVRVNATINGNYTYKYKVSEIYYNDVKQTGSSFEVTDKGTIKVVCSVLGYYNLKIYPDEDQYSESHPMGSVTNEEITNVPSGCVITFSDNKFHYYNWVTNGTITVTATPNNKDLKYANTFTNWYYNQTKKESGNTVTLTSNAEICAGFTRSDKYYTIKSSVTPEGAGSTSEKSVKYGNSTSIYTEPNFGFTFSYWTCELPDGTTDYDDGTQTYYIDTVEGNYSPIAHFTRINYKVSFNISTTDPLFQKEGGEVQNNNTKITSISVPYGTTWQIWNNNPYYIEFLDPDINPDTGKHDRLYLIDAVPYSTDGYDFTSWMTASGTVLDNTTIAVNFKLRKYQITTEIITTEINPGVNAGYIDYYTSETTSSEGLYVYHGTTIPNSSLPKPNAIAYDANGYQFASWAIISKYGTASATSATSSYNPYPNNITIKSNTRLSAYFSLINYEVDFEFEDVETGEVITNGQVLDPDGKERERIAVKHGTTYEVTCEEGASISYIRFNDPEGTDKTYTIKAGAGYKINAITTPSSRSITSNAKFTIKLIRRRYDITTAAKSTRGEGYPGGTVSGDGEYRYGDTAVITATPYINYELDHWEIQGDGATSPTTVRTSTSTYTIQEVTTGGKFTAVFRYLGPYYITYSSEGADGGNIPTEVQQTEGKQEKPDYNVDINLYYNTGKLVKNKSRPNGYKVTYDGNGGLPGTSSDYAQDTMVYTCGGWSTTSGSTSVEYNLGGTYSGNEDITIYPAWNASRSRGTVTLTGAYYDIEHEFKGWYTEKTGGTRVGTTGDTYKPSKDTTLYAQWNTYTYDVNVVPNNSKYGHTTGGGNYKYGDKIIIAAYENPGFDFKYWTYPDGSSESRQTSEVTIYAESTYTAVFESTATPFTISVNDQTMGTLSQEALSISTSEFIHIDSNTISIRVKNTSEDVCQSIATPNQSVPKCYFIGWFYGTPGTEIDVVSEGDTLDDGIPSGCRNIFAKFGYSSLNKFSWTSNDNKYVLSGYPWCVTAKKWNELGNLINEARLRVPAAKGGPLPKSSFETVAKGDIIKSAHFNAYRNSLYELTAHMLPSQPVIPEAGYQSIIYAIQYNGITSEGNMSLKMGINEVIDELYPTVEKENEPNEDTGRDKE